MSYEITEKSRREGVPSGTGRLFHTPDRGEAERLLGKLDKPHR